MQPLVLKGVVYPKMQILSLFTHCNVVPNLYSLYFVLNTKEDFLKNVANQAVAGPD